MCSPSITDRINAQQKKIQHLLEDDDLIRIIEELARLGATEKVFVTTIHGHKAFHDPERSAEALALCHVELQLQTY